MSYKFQSALYRNRSDMLDAIAYEFMTGDGANAPEIVDTFVRISPESLAAECIGGWGLDVPGVKDDSDPSHMETHGYTAEDLANAIANFIENRPDRNHTNCT